METSTRFEVIVVGAGPGGTPLASLLAGAGVRVLLVDRNPRAGGRMMTVTRAGHRYELFPIRPTPRTDSLYERQAADVGKSGQVTVLHHDQIPSVLVEGADGVFRPFVFTAGSLLRTIGWAHPVRLVRTLRALGRLAAMRPEQIDTLWDVSAYDYFHSLRLPETLEMLVTAAFGEGSFEMTSDRVPAAAAVTMFQIASRDTRALYFREGIGGFFETMASTVTEHGGEVLPNTTVASINLACVGYRYFTTRPVLDHETTVIFPRDCLEPWADFEKMAHGKKKPTANYVYVGTKSVYPGISPDGKQIIYACMSCSPDPDQDLQPYLDYVERRTGQVFPALFTPGVIEDRQVMGPRTVAGLGPEPIFPGQGGESYGIANLIGQTGPTRPAAHTPVTGLYIVGNDDAGFGLGTQQAMDSAYALFAYLMSTELATGTSTAGA